jgi:hypothetical protein
VEPVYGVDLSEDDYLLLLPSADLRMDPAFRPHAVSLVVFAYSVTFCNSTTQLNDGIFTVHPFSDSKFTPLRKSEFFFQFYVYGGIFDNPPGFLSARGTVCFCFFVFLCFVAWGGRRK